MELVVVVTGVLLALWAQEWAQDRERRAYMNSALEAVRIEARDNLMLMLGKQSLDQCLIDREALIRDRLISSGRQWVPITEYALVTGDAPGPLKNNPVRGVIQRNGDTFKTSAFRSALTTGALSTLDRKRFDALNNLYSVYDQINAEEAKGDQSIRELAALVQPIEMTPEIKARMFGALYSADRTRFAIEYAWWNDIVGYYHQLGWDDPVEIDRLIAADDALDKETKISWRPCRKPLQNPFRDKPVD